MSFVTVVVLAAVLAAIAPLVSDIYSKASGHEVKHFDIVHRMEWQITAFSAVALLLVLLAIYLSR